MKTFWVGSLIRCDFRIARTYRRSLFGNLNDTLGGLIDLERTTFHLHLHVILLGRLFLGYSPRVPAGEASSILEFAGLDFCSIRRGDGEPRIGRPATVHHQIAAGLTSRADQ